MYPHEHPARPNMLPSEAQIRLNEQLGLDTGLAEHAQVAEAQSQRIQTGQDLFRRYSVDYNLGQYSEDDVRNFVQKCDKAVARVDLPPHIQKLYDEGRSDLLSANFADEYRWAGMDTLQSITGNAGAYAAQEMEQKRQEKLREEQAQEQYDAASKSTKFLMDHSELDAALRKDAALAKQIRALGGVINNEIDTFDFQQKGRFENNQALRDASRLGSEKDHLFDKSTLRSQRDRFELYLSQERQKKAQEQGHQAYVDGVRQHIRDVTTDLAVGAAITGAKGVVGLIGAGFNLLAKPFRQAEPEAPQRRNLSPGEIEGILQGYISQNGLSPSKAEMNELREYIRTHF